MGDFLRGANVKENGVREAKIEIEKLKPEVEIGK